MEKIINVQHLSFGYDEDTLTIDDISVYYRKRIIYDNIGT